MLCSLCCLLLLCIGGRGVTLVASWGWLALHRRTVGIGGSSCTSANCPHRFLLHNPPFTSSQNYSISTLYFCMPPVVHALARVYLRYIVLIHKPIMSLAEAIIKVNEPEHKNR